MISFKASPSEKSFRNHAASFFLSTTSETNAAINSWLFSPCCEIQSFYRVLKYRPTGNILEKLEGL